MSQVKDDISEQSAVASYPSSPGDSSQIELPPPDDIMVINVFSTTKFKVIVTIRSPLGDTCSRQPIVS